MASEPGNRWKRTARLRKGVALLFVAITAALLLREYTQLRFEGKTLDHWVAKFPLMVDAAGNEEFDDERLQKSVAEAGRGVRGFGPRALPRLDRELRATDSKLGLMRWNLEVRLSNTLRRHPTYVLAIWRRAKAMSALSELGEIAIPYVDELKTVSTNAAEEPVVRGHARWAIEKLAPHTLPEAEHRWCKVNYGMCGLRVVTKNPN